MQLYVSTLGSDANDGLTPATALASIETGLRRLPDSDRNQVHVAPGLYEEPTLTIRGGREAPVSGVSVRGSGLVARCPAQGPQSEAIALVDALSDGKTRVHFNAGGWVPSAHLRWRARIKRGETVVLNLPGARNGDKHVDFDVGRMLVGGPHLAELIQPGDVFEWVKNAVEVRGIPSQNLGSACIRGSGAGFWNFDPGNQPGGANGHTFENITFTSAVFSMNAHGISYADCDFENIDNNWLGGSAYFVNCTSRGMQFQGGFCVEHDQAGPRGQPLNAPSMELLVVGSMRVGTGGGNSALGASYLAEKNVSVYDAISRPAINVVRGSFVANPPSAASGRIVALQGDGNSSGIRCSLGGYVRVNHMPEVPQLTGGAELVLEGSNPESWSSFLAQPIAGNLQNLNGRITTAFPS